MSDKVSERELAVSIVDFLMEHSGNDGDACVRVLAAVAKAFMISVEIRDRGAGFEQFCAELDALMAGLDDAQRELQ